MANDFIDFTDKICVVTGAGSPNGIGFSTARILASLGGKVAIISTTDRIHRRKEELIAMGYQAESYIADLMDRAQVKDTVCKIKNSCDKIDVLINNAGMVQVGGEEDFSTLDEVTYESWDMSIDRNLNLCFNVTKEALPAMIENNYGRIVNISSVTGPVVSNPGSASYSAAKAGILGMSRSLAIEVGSKNITVNSVLPGWIATASQTEKEAVGGLNTPMGRGGSAEEVANAAVFLASDAASYITGEYIVVDGGNTIQEYKGPKESYY